MRGVVTGNKEIVRGKCGIEGRKRGIGRRRMTVRRRIKRKKVKVILMMSLMTKTGMRMRKREAAMMTRRNRIQVKARTQIVTGCTKES